MVAGKERNVGLLAAYSSLSNVIQGPSAALFYGAWGVLPFISIPIYLCSTGNHISELLHANLTYGAGIFSFLGAVRWGLAIPNSKDKTLRPTYKNLGWAITPVSVAWIALLLSETNANLIILGGFLSTIVQDAYSTAYPAWYKSFRIIFSSCAVFSFSTCLLMFWNSMK